MMFCEMTKRPFERIQNNLHRFVYFEPVVFTIWIVSVVREHRLLGQLDKASLLSGQKMILSGQKRLLSGQLSFLTLKLYHQTCYSLIRSILVGTKIVIFVETKAKYYDN